MRYPVILAAALAATAFAVPAAAADTETVAVRYADLDLSTSAGQAQLERRIDSAAREVCGIDDVATGTRLASRSAKECFAETKSRLNERIAAAVARGNDRG